MGLTVSSGGVSCHCRITNQAKISPEMFYTFMDMTYCQNLPTKIRFQRELKLGMRHTLRYNCRQDL